MVFGRTKRRETDALRAKFVTNRETVRSWTARWECPEVEWPPFDEVPGPWVVAPRERKRWLEQHAPFLDTYRWETPLRTRSAVRRCGNADEGGGVITWRRVTEEDFGLLRTWLAQPHVARWWHHDTSAEAVARDFGPAARGEEPSEDLLVMLDGTPVALVQRCRFADYPDYRQELADQVELPEGAVTLDYLLADPARVGQGLGPRILRAVVAATWTDDPDASAVVVPVNAANRASWRALEKTGLRRVGTVDLAPDNPADERAHHVYRIDRPADAPS
ncbi:GNAT family N-acetyltransferase [Streptomyces smyrnaeus]|uniref:GNAT family N-acetyltransferase n=1 Tax=Streptomyces smyrnaeus TaxID=1387713 RepID=UPI0033CE87E9